MSSQNSFMMGQKTSVHRLGYGGMQLTGPGVFGDAPDRKTAMRILQTAVEKGVNFIDTADSYGPHTNEILIAEALKPFKQGLFIATKGGLERPAPNVWTPNGNPDYIRKAIDGSLQRLGVDCLDLWQLHRVDSKFPIEETLRPVAEAVKAGKIKYVGLSEVGIEAIERAQKVVNIVSVQNLYNLGERNWDKVVDYTQKKGIAFIPWFPLASGPEKLAGTVREIATRHQASTAQVALAWLLKRSDNILLIPGTSSVEHLNDNLKAGDLQLTESEFAQLSK